MPMPILTELKVKAAKPADKPCKLFDERGYSYWLRALADVCGAFGIGIGGVEKLLTLGASPDVSLKRAREKRDDARRAVAEGIDPSAKRQAEHDAVTNTFAAVADEWLLQRRHHSQSPREAR